MPFTPFAYVPTATAENYNIYLKKMIDKVNLMYKEINKESIKP